MVVYIKGLLHLWIYAGRRRYGHNANLWNVPFNRRNFT